MDRFMIGILILLILLTSPFIMAAVYSWFTPIELGYKIGITLVVCSIWIPVIGAWIHANR